jgi:SAM-dependent methyltransferase
MGISHTFEKQLLSLQGIPLFQSRMYDTKEEALKCPKINVVLTEDLSTGLVSNSAFDYNQIDYGQDYNNDQSFSGVFSEHLNHVLQILLQYMGQGRYVEIGCGKGGFLSLMEAANLDVWGCDPTYSGTKQNILKKYFSKEMRFDKAHIVLRHVLEHIPNPAVFLQDIKASNNGGGLIYIEVPSLEWILEHKAWYDITGEHCNYFTRDYFLHVFEHIHYIGNTFGGQYISIIASLESLNTKAGDPCCEIVFPSDFMPDFDKYRSINRELVVWGAAGKGVMFCHHAMKAGVKIAGIIDINPGKQGKYIASSGLKVEPPESIRQMSHGSIAIMNQNYRSEIVHFCGHGFTYLEL